MSGTDHLAKARDYIAKGDDYYAKAANEIVVAMKEDPTLSYREVDRRVGKESRNGKWSAELVQWYTSAQATRTPTPFGGEENNTRKDDSKAKKVLSDPERRRRVIESLEPQEVEALAEQATEVAVERARAKRAEHDTTPTVKDLMGDDPFDPAEFWADTLIIRLDRNARELESLIKRGGGLRYGSMTPDEAFEYLNHAERLIAEARAAAQEQVRDGVEA